MLLETTSADGPPDDSHFKSILQEIGKLKSAYSNLLSPTHKILSHVLEKTTNDHISITIKNKNLSKGNSEKLYEIFTQFNTSQLRNSARKIVNSVTSLEAIYNTIGEIAADIQKQILKVEQKPTYSQTVTYESTEKEASKKTLIIKTIDVDRTLKTIKWTLNLVKKT